MLNPKKLNIQVLNLRRSPQRWDFVSTHLAEQGLKCNRVEAIDGQYLPAKEIAQNYDAPANKKHYFWPLKPSEIGCYMSHRIALSTFVNDTGSDILLLLEDDVEAHIELSRDIEEWLRVVDTPLPTMLKLFTKRAVTGSVVTSVAGIKIRRPNRIPLGCQAQLINKPAAIKLLAFSAPFDKPIDVDYQLWWRHGVDVLCTEISLFNEVSNQLGGSSIAGSGNLSIGKKIKRELGRTWFRTKLTLTSRLYRLIKKPEQG